MIGWGTLALAALAGLNPWVVLVIVVGLATFTRHATLNQPYSEVANVIGLALFGVVLGIEVVLSKVKSTARWLEVVNVPAAAVTGALLPFALIPPSDEVLWLGIVGLGVALAVRWLRLRAAPLLDKSLRPFGHVAASMVADLMAGVGSAGVLALHAVNA